MTHVTVRLLKEDGRPAPPAPSMAHRRIVDSNEQVWDVWEVIPSLLDEPAAGVPRSPRAAGQSRRLIVPPEMEAGWLAFQCGEQRRRIAPLPKGWSEMSDDALLALMDVAPAVRSRGVRTT